ncbi:MAG: hypothetical protein QOE11_1137 [Solirubrobacteraceae bacterium]|jgi:hypothetical protein|nr:hypothetical protein [Solirubrobacteraceae bacterium]
MTELALLAIFSRLMTWGLGPVIATRTVAADSDAVHDLLSDPANQRRLLNAAARLRAAVRVRVVTPRVLKTELTLCGRTVAWATWIVSAGRGTTEVDLLVQLQSRGLLARTAMVLGGERWIARRLEAVLGRLATLSAHAAENVIELPSAASVLPRAGRRKNAPAPDAKHAALHR